MKKIILINKKEGETPLEALENFRKKNKSYSGLPMTYAGRLDPMARGLMLFLAGEEVNNKEKYLGLDKEYEFEVLFGVATDTHDILGKIIKCEMPYVVGELQIKNNLKFFKGRIKQKYPRYSSKNIKKVLAGEEVNEIEREITVKDFKFLGLKTISSKNLLKNTTGRIKKVKGDFRQEEIIKIWSKNFKNKNQKLYICRFKIKCSSGTYVRMISHELGEKMGIPALAYSIKRTKIGNWKLKE